MMTDVARKRNGREMHVACGVAWRRAALLRD